MVPFEAVGDGERTAMMAIATVDRGAGSPGARPETPRFRPAMAHVLDALFHPSAAAIIGASTDPTKIAGGG